MALLWEQWAYHNSGKVSEHDRRAEMNVAFTDGHTRWIRLSDTTSSRYGSGPDLHWLFQGNDRAQLGQDFTN